MILSVLFIFSTNPYNKAYELTTPLTPVSKTELHSYAYNFNVGKCSFISELNYIM